MVAYNRWSCAQLRASTAEIAKQSFAKAVADKHFQRSSVCGLALFAATVIGKLEHLG
jgi:hypothetical protein